MSKQLLAIKKSIPKPNEHNALSLTTIAWFISVGWIGYFLFNVSEKRKAFSSGLNSNPPFSIFDTHVCVVYPPKTFPFLSLTILTVGDADFIFFLSKEPLAPSSVARNIWVKNIFFAPKNEVSRSISIIVVKVLVLSIKVCLPCNVTLCACVWLACFILTF